MRKFFISTHGHMASGIKSSLNILLGECHNVTVFDAYLDERTVQDELDQFYESVNKEDQIILLSDLYGGSVNQVMYQYANKPNTFVVTGINLALVLELVSMSENPITKDELLMHIEMAKSMMKVVEIVDKQEKEEDFF